MLIPTIVMGLLAIILVVMGYYKGQGQHISGVKSGLNMAVEILPLLISAFIVAGMVQPAAVIGCAIGVAVYRNADSRRCIVHAAT